MSKVDDKSKKVVIGIRVTEFQERLIRMYADTKGIKAQKLILDSVLEKILMAEKG